VTERHWKIGEVAEALGTTARTLRFYEEQGLLRPRRTGRGTRLYTSHDWVRAQAILRLAALGIRLEEIRELADLRAASASGDEAGHRVHRQLGALRNEVEGIRAACDELLADIDEADALVRRCYRCPNPPTPSGCPQCPAHAAREDVPLLEVIWEEEP
jgi:DNA-binding transcriptional MerR regulator